MPPDYLVTIVAGAERRRWCDRCLTSAAVEVDVYAFDPHQDIPPPHVGTVGGCTRCDPHLFDD